MSHLLLIYCTLVVLYTVNKGSFAVGYCFYYWNHYKKMGEFDQNQEGNTNGHSGYTISDLFVP